MLAYIPYMDPVGYTKLWGLLCFYYGCLDTGHIRKPFLGRDAIEDPSSSSPPWETSGLGPYPPWNTAALASTIWKNPNSLHFTLV